MNEVIKPHPTHSMYDSSKIQEFLSCPRKYFYRYILGWEIDQPNVHLVFGEGWHRAMEVLLHEGYTTEAIQHAFEKFNNHYREHFTQIEDASNFPKSPESVVPALVDYITKYADDLTKYEVMYTEIAGTVPVSDSRVLHFRLDSVLKGDKGIFSREHKTGSRLGATWTGQWDIKVQMGTYLHVLYSMYNPDEVVGLEINGVIFYKSRSNEYIRYNVRTSGNMMKAWLWEVNHFLDMRDWNLQELEASKVSDDVMAAFPRNPESCTKYMRLCKFHDFCTAWANPLQRCDQCPFDFKVEYWNPAEREIETRWKRRKRG